MLKIGIPNEIQIVESLMLLIIAIFPFLNMYSTPIKGIGIADFLYLILLFCYFVQMLKNRQILTDIGKCSLMLIVLASSNFLLILFLSDKELAIREVLLRTLRFIAYHSVAIFFPITYERREKIQKIIIYSSWFATFILILQNIVLRFWGIYINAFIPGLPLTSSEGIKTQVYNIYNMGGRSFSFFSEPSTYAMYVGFALLLLMSETNRKKFFFLRGFLTVGLLLSGATTGLACVLFVYGSEALRNILRNNLRIGYKKLLILLMTSPMLLLFLLRSASVQSMISRIKHMSSLIDRVDGYKVFFFDFNLFERLLGHGMNDNITDFFMSSYPRLYYYWGIVGLILVMGIVYCLYKKIDKLSRKVLLFVLFMNITTVWSWGTYIFISYGMILSIPFYKCRSNDKARG